VACAAVAVAILGPVFGRGFVLVYDMVFTPHQPLLPESVGLASGLPRAVPADAVVAILGAVIPGELLQKLILAATVFAAAWGAGRLVPTAYLGVRVVAAIGYAWNAYLAERLFLGHWTLLVGYASLPWVFAAGLRMRRGEARVWPALVLACAAAALAPSGGLLATGAALAAAGWRKAGPIIAVNLVLNAPWLVPGALHPGRALSDPAAVDAFRVRAEGPGGPLASVLSLGGIWNSAVVPAGRTGPLVPLAALVLTAAAAYGAIELRHRWKPAQPGLSSGAGGHWKPAQPGPPSGAGGRSNPARALLGLALGGVLVALAGTAPGTGAVLRWAVAHVPGAGLLRDGQKWTAWWALLAALGLALAAEAIATRSRFGVLVGAALLPIALLPDLAWGGLGRLEPVRYPPDWAQVRTALSDSENDVLVLPFQPYRRFAWNDQRPQLDPAPRWLPNGAVTDDTLRVGNTVIRGESPRADRLRIALAEHTSLAAQGIGWVLVERGTPGEVDPALLRDLENVYSGQWLALYRVPGKPAEPRGNVPSAAAVITADLTAKNLIVAALITIVSAPLRRRLPIGRFK